MLKMTLLMGAAAAAAAGYYWMRNAKGEMADHARDAVDGGLDHAKHAVRPANDLLDDVVAST